MATTPDAAFEPQALLEQLPFIRALARNLLEDPAAAEDVAQDAVVTALEQKHPAATLRPWLFGVTRNLARLLFRRETRRSNRERAAATREILPSASDESVRFEALRRVVLALDRLVPDERALLVRRFYDEWPPRRIAADLGIPVNTVRTRIARGLANLRRELVGARPKDEPANLRALLIPLLSPPAASSVIPLVPIVAGGLLVSTKVKLALAAALVVAASVGIAIWSAGREGAPAAAAVARSTPLPAESAAEAATADATRETTVDAPRTMPAAVPRARVVALSGRLFGEPGALARWTTPVEVFASTEVARNGQVVAPPAPDRLRRSIAVAADGSFAEELQIDGAAPRIARLTLKGADPAFAPFERRFAVPAGTAELAWNVEARLFETAVLRGHVVDATGQPVPDGAVAAFALRGRNAELLGETLVDADGTFALGVNGSSPCFVVATQRQVDSGSALAKTGRRDVPALLPAVAEATPTVGRETDLGDLVLRQGAAIRGRVEWFAHGPVAGVRVNARPFVRTTPPTEEFDMPVAGTAYAIARLTRPVLLPSGMLARADATTDERGEFEIAGLPPGPAHVRVSTFLRGMMCEAFQERSPLEVDAPSDSLLLRFDGAHVEFEVTSRGRPLEGAMVFTGIPSATWRATWKDQYVAGPEGVVESVLPPGVDADWSADAQGHASAHDRFRSPAAGDRVRIHVELEPVETKPSLIVRLADEAGAPVTTAGFQLERVQAADAVSTPGKDRPRWSFGGAGPCAPDGCFVLNDLAPDTYQLRIRPGGTYRAGDGCYAEIERAITVHADRVDEIELVAVAAGRLRAAARDGRGRFLGAILLVRDEKGVEVPTQPILHQELENGEWISDRSNGDHLATDGFCHVDPPLAPGRYTANFTLAGFAPKTVAFEIGPLQPYDLEVVLDPLR